jgi:hypothetical protein
MPTSASEYNLQLLCAKTSIFHLPRDVPRAEYCTERSTSIFYSTQVCFVLFILFTFRTLAYAFPAIRSPAYMLKGWRDKSFHCSHCSTRVCPSASELAFTVNGTHLRSSEWALWNNGNSVLEVPSQNDLCWRTLFSSSLPLPSPRCPRGQYLPSVHGRGLQH